LDKQNKELTNILTDVCSCFQTLPKQTIGLL